MPEVRKGVLIPEGSTREMDDRDLELSPLQLSLIVEATAKYMRENVVWLFLDHVHTQENKVGQVTGVPYLADYPSEIQGPEKRVGKAIVTDEIVLLSKEVIQQWQEGTAKDLSVSIDGSGAIFAVSLVGIGAFRGAQMFSAQPSTPESKKRVQNITLTIRI